MADELEHNDMRSKAVRFEIAEGSTPGRLYIDDDDFHWDGALAVSGDFESEAEKRRYMQAICDVLNANEGQIPFQPLSES